MLKIEISSSSSTSSCSSINYEYIPLTFRCGYFSPSTWHAERLYTHTQRPSRPLNGGKLFNVKLISTDNSFQSSQIKKLKKADWHFFGQISLTMNFPTICTLLAWLHAHRSLHAQALTQSSENRMKTFQLILSFLCQNRLCQLTNKSGSFLPHLACTGPYTAPCEWN